MVLEVKTKKVTGTSTAEKTKSGDTVDKQEKIHDVGSFDNADDFARVGIKMGFTKNLGDYESFRVDVHLEVPVPNDLVQINEMSVRVHDWVDAKMEEILNDIET